MSRGAAHYETTVRQPAVVLAVGQRWSSPGKAAREVMTLWPAGAMSEATVRIRKDGGAAAVVILQSAFRIWIGRWHAVVE